MWWIFIFVFFMLLVVFAAILLLFQAWLGMFIWVITSHGMVGGLIFSVLTVLVLMLFQFDRKGK